MDNINPACVEKKNDEFSISGRIFRVVQTK